MRVDVYFWRRLTSGRLAACLMAAWGAKGELPVANETQDTQATRRGFLSGMTALTAASYSRVLGANDHPGIGFIGFGLIGQQHITNFKRSFPDVDRVAMCDVYKPRLDEGLAYLESPNAKSYGDFRRMYENKDIDGVVVATPDHWHAMLTIMACAAGKDVYVEKPLTVFVDEGKWMLQARDKYKRVVVVGTQRNNNPGHLVAKKIVESGVLGQIQMVKLGGSGRNIYPGFGKTPVADPPPGFDYDLWLGPAPKKPYQAHRGLYHFPWFWGYSGGQMTNLGAHIVDQILWLMDAKGPTSVTSIGGRYALDDDDGETPDLQDAIWEFPGKNGAPGFTLECSIREASVGPQGMNPAQLYLGTKGYMNVSGNYTITSETKVNAIDDIPRFQGHPIGGPVYPNAPRTPWLPESATTPATAGRGGGAGRGAAPGGAPGQGRGAAPAAVATDSRCGLTATGADPTMVLNERDWSDCIKSRNRPFC